MHDHDTSERLASYADVLAGKLPDTWTSTLLSADAKDDLADLPDRIWDLDLAAAWLAEHPLPAVLSRPDGAQFVLLTRYDRRDGFLVAAVAPSNLPYEAYRGPEEIFTRCPKRSQPPGPAPPTPQTGPRTPV